MSRENGEDGGKTNGASNSRHWNATNNPRL